LLLLIVAVVGLVAKNTPPTQQQIRRSKNEDCDSDSDSDDSEAEEGRN